MSEYLKERFAYFTECQLATVQRYRTLKRPPKHELERHESIADKMVAVCRSESIAPTPNTPRLAKIINLREQAK